MTTLLVGAICKWDKAADGTLTVEGICSTEARDSQREIVKAAAMKAAIPEYLRFPAIREMHQPIAAGRALALDVGDDGVTRVVARIVDPVAIRKVEERVYNGFSIGGQALKRNESDPSVIESLRLTEISLVDRPANPEATFTLVKVEASTTEKSGANEPGHPFWGNQHAAAAHAASMKANKATDRALASGTARDHTAAAAAHTEAAKTHEVAHESRSLAQAARGPADAVHDHAAVSHSAMADRHLAAARTAKKADDQETNVTKAAPAEGEVAKNGEAEQTAAPADDKDPAESPGDDEDVQSEAPDEDEPDGDESPGAEDGAAEETAAADAKKGDYPGHPFRGNQHAEGKKTKAHHKASKAAHDASRAASGSRDAKAHNDATKAHREAAKAHAEAGNKGAAEHHNRMADVHRGMSAALGVGPGTRVKRSDEEDNDVQKTDDKKAAAEPEAQKRDEVQKLQADYEALQKRVDDLTARLETKGATKVVPVEKAADNGSPATDLSKLDNPRAIIGAIHRNGGAVR